MDDSESIDIREQSDGEDCFCGSLCCEVPLLLLSSDVLLQLMVVMVESDLGLDATRVVMLMQRIASDAAAPPLIIEGNIILLAMFIYLEGYLIGVTANKRLEATNNLALHAVVILDFEFEVKDEGGGRREAESWEEIARKTSTPTQTYIHHNNDRLASPLNYLKVQ